MYQDLFFLLYYCTFNNKSSFRWKFTSFLRSVPYQNVLFYFKSFRFVASLVALHHSIVKFLAVKLSSSSDLLYFLQVAGQFPFFGHDCNNYTKSRDNPPRPKYLV